jgi:serine/threonine protein kinase
MDEETLFYLAIAKPPGERSAFLAAACDGNPALRERVESLLAAYENPGSFLGRPPVDLVPPTTAGADPGGPPPAPGGTVGAYRVIESLGEGGMGTVYRAEQTHPVRRAVAVKVIKPGMDTRDVVARFEAERQALALMDHPNIAKVLDAGTTPEGRPFFVMELVEGVPITTFCDDRGWTIPRRLGLFVEVCQAVQHAHQKGVIHRDLKPTNVLVALYDGKPVPKVIDFGVAKAVGRKLADETMVTEVGAVIGTLEYMSPEQAEPNQLDVDTRGDVYSLGVLLYELLTGTTPHRRERLREAPLLEALRLIREEEPPKPGTRLSTAEELSAVAASRGADPRRLAGLVRGELDWIVMRALEKDRDRRYESAAALAADVGRYLADEPVLAGPPTAWYRLRKFARRNRWPLLAVGAVVGGLVAGIIGTTWGLIRSETARVETARALDQVSEAQGWTQRALVAVKRSRMQAQDAVRGLTDAVVEKLLARHPTLGDEETAFLRNAHALCELAVQGSDDSEEGRAAIGLAHANFALIRHRLGDERQAEVEYKTARDILQRLADDFPANQEYRRRLARLRSNFGSFLGAVNRPRDAEAELAAALEEHRRLVSESGERSDREWMADIHYNLANLFKRTNRLRDAQAQWAAARGLYERLVSENPAERQLRSRLASIRAAVGHSLGFSDRARAAEAEAELIASRDIQLSIIAESPNDRQYRERLAEVRMALGGCYLQWRRLKDAEPECLAARDLFRGLAAEFPAVPQYTSQVGGALVNLAIVARLGERYADAKQLLEEAVPFHKAALAVSPGHTTYREYYRNNRYNLAMALLSQGNHAAVPPVLPELVAQSNRPADDAVLAAKFLAFCAEAAMEDMSLTQSRRAGLREGYARLAVDYLQTATTHGFQNRAQVRRDSMFDPIRDSPDFRDWLAGKAPRREQAPPPRPLRP